MVLNGDLEGKMVLILCNYTAKLEIQHVCLARASVQCRSEVAFNM